MIPKYWNQSFDHKLYLSVEDGQELEHYNNGCKSLQEKQDDMS